MTKKKTASKRVDDPMSKGYWERWNSDVQAKIDENIEKYRKADADWKIAGLKPGTEVQADQIGHDFIFGAHIFNYDQLGTDERNEKYKELFGSFFNSATIAFYWKTLEPVEGHPRFEGEFRDTAEFWNTVKEPKLEPHWRRPAPDPVVRFCKSKGIRLHGHPMVWGNYKWHFPAWVNAKLPAEWAKRMQEDWSKDWSPAAELFNHEDYTAEQLEKMLPGFGRELWLSMAKRIYELAERYGGDIDSWDVCNESAVDFEKGSMVPGSSICKSVYGLMPGDYTYRAFKLADALLPKKVKLNINDYHMGQPYPDQIRDLLGRGCKIDIMGAQMHLFDPKTCLDIADGKSDRQSPDEVFSTMERLSQADLPIHLSEITITAPNNDARGQALQAVIARNLYRLWFSVKNMMGITWWNAVDDCGAPGEPAVSGLFSRDMVAKEAFHALDDLINHEWKTSVKIKAGAGGKVKFRGFRGKYRLTWTEPDGQIRMKFIDLK